MSGAGSAQSGSAQCSAGELGELFLFERLTEAQLAWLCREGRVLATGPGTVYAEGEPAAFFYVLLSGTIALYRRIGADDIEVVRTSGRGAYAGAFIAYLGDRVPQVYSNSMRAIERSRFFVLAADKFARLMTDWFPMAVHLLDGLFFGTRNIQEVIGQRERLLALGSLTAGLAHELNNPAAAAARAAGSLRDQLAGQHGRLALAAAGLPGGALLATLARLAEEAAGQAARPPELGPVEAADREDEVADWLAARGVASGWQLAPALAQAGLGTGWLDRAAAELADNGTAGPALDGALSWLAATAETGLLLTDIVDSVARISALVGAARQYSQLDRAPYQDADVHELLDSTLAMLGGKIGDGVTVIRDYDRSLPPVPGYPAELNQVWTNLIDNAVAAMAGRGSLTIRTAAERDQLLVEFRDTGPGVPEQIRDRIFEPFFTTKPVGEGTGLGLDICWRIIVTRHHGDLRVDSVPGDTRFQVRLPLTAAASTGRIGQAGEESR